MTSTFTGLEMGKRSLITHQTSLQTIAHNIDNMDVEGYSKQRVRMSTVNPLEDPSYTREERSGQLGQGVEATEVRRERDIFLDKRISTEVSNNSYWENKANILSQVESIHNSLGENNLQEKLDAFWSSWQELSTNPKEVGIRANLVSKTQDLTSGFNSEFRQLNTLREELDVKVKDNVAEINSLSKNIANLNEKIVQAQAVGDNPNDWLDERDRLVEKLSTLVDVSINEKDPDEPMVFINGKVLIQGGKYNELEFRGNKDNEGLGDVYLSSGELYAPLKGQLAAHLDMRDKTVKDQIRRLDSLASSLIFGVNEIHKEGFDNYQQKGEDFFKVENLSANAFGNFDINADGIQNVSMIYKTTGSQTVDKNKVVGENGQMTFQSTNSDDPVVITYTANERIGAVLEKINNSNANVNAYIDNQNKLVLRARSSMENKSLAIKHIEDNGQFLVGVTGILKASGNPGAYDSNAVDSYNQLNGGMDRSFQTPLTHPSDWININSHLVENPNFIAASGGREFDGDGKNDASIGILNSDTALKISGLRYSKVSVDESRTYNEFYVDMVNNVALSKQMSENEVTKYSAIVGDLKELRQQVSGVNVDEEMTNMIAMQHGYQAAAKLISTLDSMLDTIINRMT